MSAQIDEKDQLLFSQVDLEANQRATADRAARASSTRRIAHMFSMVITTILMTTLVVTNTGVVSNSSPIYRFFEFFSAPVATPVVEVFEIAPQIVLPTGAVVKNTTIFNGTLADGLSYKYKAPANFTYTGALLTLNFTNEDLADKKPLVAEISLGANPIWRTSTPASAAGSITHSSTTKNVTEILSLFETSGKFSIKLLEGEASKVNVTLELSLISEPASTVAAASLFTASGPADLVYPLTNKGEPFKVPGDKLTLALPQLESNVSYAKLSLFASATEDEIAYFKQDIGKVGEPSSTGPLRFINIFVNNVYVSSISPKPTLFHSNDISNNDNTSTLWQPLADTGSLQGLSYEVDLVGVLPLLWAGDAKLDVVVVSPIGGANKAPGAPPALPHPVLPTTGVITTGSWFISGNLLAWESPSIISAVGAIIGVNSSELDSGIVIEPPAVSPWQPAMKNQIIKTTIDATVISQLNFTLADDSLLNYTVTFNSSTHAFLTKQDKKSKKTVGPPGSPLGSTTTSTQLVLIAGIKNKIDVVDTNTELSTYTKKQSFDFPFTFKETIIETTTALGTTTSESVKAKINSDIQTKVNGVKTNSYKVKTSVELDEIIGATTDIKVKIENVDELPFSREVEATNGVITKDTLTSSMAEDLMIEDITDAIGQFL